MMLVHAGRRKAAKTHLKINRQRRDQHFKTAKPYAQGYHRIVVEDLAIRNMVQNHHLAKSIMDASWGAFLDILEEQAARAGHQVMWTNCQFVHIDEVEVGHFPQKCVPLQPRDSSDPAFRQPEVSPVWYRFAVPLQEVSAWVLF